MIKRFYDRYRLLLAAVALLLSGFVSIQIPRGLQWMPYLSEMHRHGMPLPWVVSLFSSVPATAFVELGIGCALLTIACVLGNRIAPVGSRYLLAAVLLVLTCTAASFQWGFVRFTDNSIQSMGGRTAGR
jgi:hypothetical protein